MTCTGMTRQKAVKVRQATGTHLPLYSLPYKRPAVCLFQRQRQLRRHSRQSRLPGKRPEEIQRGAGRFSVTENDIVYLEKKKKKADKPNYDHVVQVGESMHSIAQKYGIQIKSLYKMNKKHKDYIPEEGDVLKLR